MNKLDLDNDTIDELTDEALEDVAGGAMVRPERPLRTPTRTRSSSAQMAKPANRRTTQEGMARAATPARRGAGDLETAARGTTVSRDARGLRW